MRILFFLADLDGGGAQRTCVNLANNLSSPKIKVRFVVARSGGHATQWLSEHVDFVDLGVSRTRNALFRLRSELQSWRPDILFSTMVDANIIASLASLGLKKEMRVILRETNSHRARGDIRGIRRKLIGWAYRSADKVVALSSGVAGELSFDYNLQKQKLTTIGNPVDIESIQVAAEKAKKNKVEYNSVGLPVVVAIGRLTYQKGFDILIRAIAQAKQPVKLIILGEGEERNNLLYLAEELNVAHLLVMPGFVRDLSPYLASANVFVLSSRWEGFGHVIVEAMAAGVPVISTNCPHGPADIIVDGRNAIVVNNQDELGMATALDDLLLDKEKMSYLVKNAKTDIKKFDVQSITKQYSRLFQKYQSDIF